jgi:ABC-type tungstate transport system permease subunit
LVENFLNSNEKLKNKLYQEFTSIHDTSSGKYRDELAIISKNNNQDTGLMDMLKGIFESEEGYDG